MNLCPTPTIDVLHDDTVSALVLKCSMERGSESVKGWKIVMEQRTEAGGVTCQRARDCRSCLSDLSLQSVSFCSPSSLHSFLSSFCNLCAPYFLINQSFHPHCLSLLLTSPSTSSLFQQRRPSALPNFIHKIIAQCREGGALHIV